MWDDKDPNKVITEGEAADMLGLSVKQIRGLRKRGEGPQCVRVANRYMYSIQAIREWWDRQLTA